MCTLNVSQFLLQILHQCAFLQMLTLDTLTATENRTHDFQLGSITLCERAYTIIRALTFTEATGY